MNPQHECYAIWKWMRIPLLDWMRWDAHSTPAFGTMGSVFHSRVYPELSVPIPFLQTADASCIVNSMTGLCSWYAEAKQRIKRMQVGSWNVTATYHVEQPLRRSPHNRRRFFFSQFLWSMALLLARSWPSTGMK